MSTSLPVRSRAAVAWRLVLAALVTLLVVATTASLFRARSAVAAKAPAMTEAAMLQMSERHFAAHPAHGGSANSTLAAADTFLVGNDYFDTDNNKFGTPADTAFISIGQSIFFQWVAGVHTASSGDISDPSPGSLWSAPLDTGHRTYTMAFPTAGTYPFQCIFHAGFGMVGWIVVSDPAGVAPGIAARSGFVSAPWPNPTRASLTARFALAHAGRARLVAYDAAGRSVATLFDRDVPAGTYDAPWDGRGASAGRVSPGVYYLRLTGPGVHETRRVSIGR